MVDPLRLGRMLADNTLRHGYPLPVDPQVITGWAAEAGLPQPRPGRPVVFTGALYQLTPYIEALVELVGRFRDPRIPALGLRLASSLPWSSELLLTLLETPEVARGVRRAWGILGSIARLLREAGMRPAYAWEADLYSGIMLYDLGMDEEFAQQAQRVHKLLRERGVEKVITLDPHTTHALRDLYPRYVDGYGLEVQSYLEVIDPSLISTKGEAGEVTIHDPCLYARKAGVVEQPRRILAARGLRIREPQMSGVNTYCCGGPIEGLAPRLSRSIAETRLSQLERASKTIVTLCPICNANLRAAAGGRGDLRILDLAELVGNA